MDDVPLIYLDFPSYRVGAFTVIDEDCNCTIFVNARLSYEIQREAIQHELSHIEQDHFHQQDKKISLVEHEANLK